MFVEGVSQFGKNPVCGFVVVCGQDLNTEFADLIFGGHEVIGESSSYHRAMSLSVPYGTYSMKRIDTESGATKKTRISGAIQRMVGVGGTEQEAPAPKSYTREAGRTKRDNSEDAQTGVELFECEPPSSKMQ